MRFQLAMVCKKSQLDVFSPEITLKAELMLTASEPLSSPEQRAAESRGWGG